MMPPLILLVTILFLLPLTSFAESGIKPYIGLSAGTALTAYGKLSDSSGYVNSEFKPGYLVAASTGIIIPTYVANIDSARVELEFAYRSNEIDNINRYGQQIKLNGSTSVSNYMLNGYLENKVALLDFGFKNDVYITAGFGAATAQIDTLESQGTTLVKSAKDTQFAYQAGVGVASYATNKLSFDVSYRYLGTTVFEFKGVTAKYGSHNILVGMRYNIF